MMETTVAVTYSNIAGLNKLGGNISQSEISNIATDCKSDNKQ